MNVGEWQLTGASANRKSALPDFGGTSSQGVN